MARTGRILFPITLSAVAALGASVASADLLVDFDRNGTVQTGYDAFSRSVDSNPASTFETYTNSLGTSGNVTVTLSASSNVEFRDRASVTGTALNDLAEDFVFGAGFVDVKVQLEPLVSQVYLVTTYHHDTGYTVLDPDPITVSDALASGDIRANGFQETTGSSPGSIRKVTFEIASDGVNPVSFATGMLNGFEITALEQRNRETPLSVNVGRSDLTSQAGFRDFANGDNDPASASRSYIAQWADGSFFGVDVTLAAGSSHLEFRSGRGGGSALRDSLVFVSTIGDSLDMTLEGLPEGYYEIQTWHTDPNGALQAENNPFSVTVSDSVGTRTATGLEPVTASHLTGFASDGSSVLLSTQSAAGRAMLNGFSLIPISENLNVNIGASDLDAVDGYRDLSRATSSDPETASASYVMPLPETDEFPVVTVTLSTGNSHLEFRDNRSGSATGLLDSLVFVSGTGDDLILTIEGLPLGLFEIVTYHDDPNGALIDENDAFAITVSDAHGTHATTGLSASSLGEYTSIVSDGINPIVLSITAEDGRAMLNGFQLNMVPEPSTLAMLLGLALVGITARWRRRRS